MSAAEKAALPLRHPALLAQVPAASAGLPHRALPQRFRAATPGGSWHHVCAESSWTSLAVVRLNGQLATKVASWILSVNRSIYGTGICRHDTRGQAPVAGRRREACCAPWQPTCAGITGGRARSWFEPQHLLSSLRGYGVDAESNGGGFRCSGQAGHSRSPGQCEARNAVVGGGCRVAVRSGT